MPPSDFELVTAIRQGRLDAWQLFVSTHAVFMQRVARRYMKDADDAGQVYVDSLCRLRASGFKGVDESTHMRAWLRSVVRNIAIDRLRHEMGRRTRLKDRPTQSAGRGGPGASGSSVRKALFAHALAATVAEQEEALNPEHQMILQEECARASRALAELRAAVLELTTEERHALDLKYGSRLSALEIAQAMGLGNTRQAYTLLDRATRRLRRRMIEFQQCDSFPELRDTMED